VQRTVERRQTDARHWEAGHEEQRSTVDVLTAVLVVLVAIAILFEIARRVGVPYPTLFVLGGLGLAFVPGLPHIQLEPDLVLLVFLPPLLFSAAAESPIRDLRANLAALLRLSLGLVLFTMVIVAAIAHAAIPGLSWAAAFTLGAIVGPTDALAATTVIRRLGAPRVVRTLLEGEAMFNDATALVAYRAAAGAAVLGGTFILSDVLAGFAVAALGGIAIGVVVGRVTGEILRRLDDPPVEVLISVVLPFAAYLPADWLGLSGVLAAVTAGLVIGGRLGTILTPDSRVLWLTTWKMIGFVINGFVFVLIGLELPDILQGLGGRPPIEILALAALVSGVVVVARLVWVFATSLLPGSPRRVIAARDPRLARRVTFLVGWAGLRGAVSLAAALALRNDFPERNLIVLLTFTVILVTLVGQGLTLPFVLRRLRWDGIEPDGDEATLARTASYQAGLAEIERARPDWPTHQPLFDRLESGLRDRTQHLATEDPSETAERTQERIEHEQIQRGVIAAQRTAVIELRDRGEINDLTLRGIERELDLEELRMEG
jgi:Na+/H+ antiporter